jgi:ABC-type tungstate transport system substrate-binding protein
MRLVLILALALASRLGAQATSEHRIPVRKQHSTPVDTVVLRLVDTVEVVRTDTLYIAAGALAPLSTFDSLLTRDSVNCGKVVIPIPILIPIDHSSPASTVPEPASVWLVGTGLIAIGFVWGRRHKER